MALTGRLEPADVIVLAVMMFPSFPVPAPVEKKIVPNAAPVVDPVMVQFWMVLLVALAMKRIVEAVMPVLVLLMMREFPEALRPLIVTLSAPFKSISGVFNEPETVRPPLGVMVRLLQEPPEG